MSELPSSVMELGSFAERLNSVIPNRGGAAFAKKAGIGQATLNQYLSGKSEPTLSKLLAITAAADVNLLWLATGEGPKQPGGKIVSYSNGVVQADNISSSTVVSSAGDAHVNEAQGEFTTKERNDHIADIVVLLLKYGNQKMYSEIKSKLLKIKEIMEE